MNSDFNDKHLNNFLSFSNKTQTKSQRGHNIDARSMNKTGVKNMSHKESFTNDCYNNRIIDVTDINLIRETPRYNRDTRIGANMMRFLDN